MQKLLPFSLPWLAGACSLFGGLRVDTLGSGAERPGNVAAYVTVSDGDEPVTELAEENFRIYENEQLVSPEQARGRLLDRELAATHRALLAVDLAFATTPESRRDLSSAISGFVEKVRPTQAVSVFGFDGSAELKPLGEFPRGDGAVTLRLPPASGGDRSRNLNGALQRALRELDSRLAQSKRPVRVGTLIVFSSGPDLAGRISDDELDRSLEERPHLRLSIGIGEQSATSLRELGRDGFVAAQSAAALPIAFEEAAYKVRSLYEKHYLFSYCSPARAGERRLRLEVRFTDKEGNEKTGETEVDFDASGYGPACDAGRLPRMSAVRAGEKPTKAPQRSSASPPKPSDPPPPSEPPAEEAVESEDDDGDSDGAVVPPPKRPGYSP